MSNCEGEVWLANLGVEAKIRPVIVVDWDIDSNNVVFIPLTTVDRGRDQIDIPDLPFLRKKSFANIFFISQTAGSNFMHCLGELPDTVYEDVVETSNNLIESGHTFSFGMQGINGAEEADSHTPMTSRPFSNLSEKLRLEGFKVVKGDSSQTTHSPEYSDASSKNQGIQIKQPQSLNKINVPANQEFRMPLFARILLSAGAAALGLPLIL